MGHPVWWWILGFGGGSPTHDGETVMYGAPGLVGVKIGLPRLVGGLGYGRVAMVLFLTPAAMGVTTGVAMPMNSTMVLVPPPTHTLPEPSMAMDLGLINTLRPVESGAAL